MATVRSTLLGLASALRVLALKPSGPTGRFASEARVAVRTQAFRLDANIPALTLSTLLSDVGTVHLPDPGSFVGGVGSVEYYYALGALVSSIKPGTILEFGTFAGTATLTMAMNAPRDCRIITIDLPEDTDGAGLDGADLDLALRAKGICGRAFRDTPFADRITQIRADSTALDVARVAQQVDLALVDGGHTYGIIKSDTEKALSVLSDRGVVVWDDYWSYYPDVVRYLDELRERLPLSRIEGTNLVVYGRWVRS